MWKYQLFYSVLTLFYFMKIFNENIFLCFSFLIFLHFMHFSTAQKLAFYAKCVFSICTFIDLLDHIDTMIFLYIKKIIEEINF